MLSRREAIAIAFAGLGVPAHAAPPYSEWAAFKSRFLLSDGRIVDTGNGGVSHTEGQGWGLLFAVTFDDQAAFAAILNWTTRTLQRSRDALHSWRYVPGGPNSVPDENNATDGDLFIAMALSRAARRWSRPDFAAAATAITNDVLRLLVRRSGSRTLLLPGVQGFEVEDGFILNPSYYAFPALQELSTRTVDPAWETVQRDGLALMQDCRFGRWMLPPDWLHVSRRDGTLKPASGWPPRFSYDAIRIPLYLAWARQTPVAVQDGFRAYWAHHLLALPAWMDLVTGAAAPFAAPPGILAVGIVSAAPASATELPADFPTVAAAPDYYSSALTLLASICWSESRSSR